MRPGAPATLTLPYRWGEVEGTVAVEIGVNDDPAALGCEGFARGFPYCRATLSPPARGYGDALGWIQMLEWPLVWEGYRTDPFSPLMPLPERDSPPSASKGLHPFSFYGFAPTFFDAPHTDRVRYATFAAQTFLAGLGGPLLELRHEARALVGFNWGFTTSERGIEIFEPAVLGPEDWDRHRDYLGEAYPDWSFAPGFAADALDPTE